MNEESDEEIIFNYEEIERNVIEIIESVLVGKTYKQNEVPKW